VGDLRVRPLVVGRIEDEAANPADADPAQELGGALGAQPVRRPGVDVDPGVGQRGEPAHLVGDQAQPEGECGAAQAVRARDAVGLDEDDGAMGADPAGEPVDPAAEAGGARAAVLGAPHAGQVLGYERGGDVAALLGRSK